MFIYSIAKHSFDQDGCSHYEVEPMYYSTFEEAMTDIEAAEAAGSTADWVVIVERD